MKAIGMTKLFLSLVFCSAILLLPTFAYAESRLDKGLIGANVQELIEWADAHNPELLAMRYEVDAASERITQSGALPDPTLRVELQDFAGPGAPNGFNPLPGQGGGTKYTLTQSLPLWGKRDLRRELATADLEQYKGRRYASVSEIHAQIKTAYVQYYQSVGLKKLNDEILQLLTDLESVAQIRYASGLVPQQDVIRAQVEKTTLRSENITLETEQHHAVTKLNTAMGRPQHAPIMVPQSLRGIDAKKLDSTLLQEKLARSNPLLTTQSAQIAMADANRRLVEKNRYPDVTLGIAPTQRGGSIDSWEAMVEVNIPIRFDTRRAQESEALAMLSAANERRQAIANQVAGELQESLSAYEAAEKQQALIQDTLLPQTELTFRSALAGYESGKVDFATLLEAQRSIKRAKQDKLRAQVEQDLRLTDIERMIGGEL
jgi:outer membrane protein TolC